MTTPAAVTHHRERYLPPAFWWLAAVLMAVIMGWLLWVPTQSLPLTAIAAVLTLALTATLVWAWGRLVVESSPAGVRAGASFIDAAHVGVPRVIDTSQWAVLLGPGSDHHAYLVTRPWLRAGVLFPVADVTDPTPYWLVASRRPHDLAAALGHGIDEGESRG